MDLKFSYLKIQLLLLIMKMFLYWNVLEINFFFQIWIILKKFLKASRLWRLIIDKKQCVPVACQGKFAEKMGVAVKSGMSHPPHLIKLFSNPVTNCPESLGEIDKQIKDFFKVKSKQLLLSEVIFHPNSSWTSNCLTSKLKFYGWWWW